MAIRRLRRSRKRWRIGIAIGLLSFLLFRCANPVGDRLDPNRWIATSGDYEFRGVGPDGAIEIVVPMEDGDRIASVRLLAVRLHDESERAAFRSTIQRLVGTSSIVRLRFDRRRLHKTTRQLQAYVFVGELMINEELARLGVAYEDTHSSDSGPMIRRIKKAEQEAREERRGVWK